MAFETGYDRDAIVNARRGKILLHPFVRLALHRHNRRANPRAGNSFTDISAMDIELIRRREFITKRIPFRSGIGPVSKDEIAGWTVNHQWRTPWIESRLVYDLENARDAKVVIANCDRVFRIAV